MGKIPRVDSKGRVLIPSSVRKTLKVLNGTELVMLHDSSGKQIRAFPMSNEKMVRLDVTFAGGGRGISPFMEALERMGAEVVMSHSNSLQDNGRSRWTFLLDASALAGGGEMLREGLSRIDGVEKLETGSC